MKSSPQLKNHGLTINPTPFSPEVAPPCSLVNLLPELSLVHRISIGNLSSGIPLPSSSTEMVSDNKSNLCIDCIDDEDCFVAFSFRNDYEKNKLYIILDEYAKERKMFL